MAWGVHLDIKPQNTLIGGEGRAMLADFGIAQRQGSCTTACTPSYASPEQTAGDWPVSRWGDIYSLGVVLYEMIAGCLPVHDDHNIVLLNQHLENTPPSPRRVNPQLQLAESPLPGASSKPTCTLASTWIWTPKPSAWSTAAPKRKSADTQEAEPPTVPSPTP
jgi:serine/threonine protein kinase